MIGSTSPRSKATSGNGASGWPEFQAQLALRMLAQRLTNPEIDSLFTLARTNGVMPIVRATAKFNQHRHLIGELFRHGPARRFCFGDLSPRKDA